MSQLLHQSNNNLKLRILYNYKNLNQIFKILRIKDKWPEITKNESFDSYTISLPKIKLITSIDKPSLFNFVFFLLLFFARFCNLPLVLLSPQLFNSLLQYSKPTSPILLDQT